MFTPCPEGGLTSDQDIRCLGMDLPCSDRGSDSKPAERNTKRKCVLPTDVFTSSPEGDLATTRAVARCPGDGFYLRQGTQLHPVQTRMKEEVLQMSGVI